MTDSEPVPLRLLAREMLSDNWYKLEKVTIEQARKDGSRQTFDREVYHSGVGAAVLPLDPVRRTVLLVRQLRIPVFVNGDAPAMIEACAGMVDAGDDPSDTVVKEAAQELGYALHSVRKLFELYTNPGVCTEKLHLFAAAYSPGDHSAKGGGLREEGEQIEILELPLDEACRMVATGEIHDAKTVILLQHAQREHA